MLQHGCLRQLRNFNDFPLNNEASASYFDENSDARRVANGTGEMGQVSFKIVIVNLLFQKRFSIGRKCVTAVFRARERCVTLL